METTPETRRTYVARLSRVARVSVATHSALKQRYRERKGRTCSSSSQTSERSMPTVGWALVRIIFSQPSLVASQFATLESPIGEPGVLRVDAALAPQAPMDAVIE